jgi:hypothetical protein
MKTALLLVLMISLAVAVVDVPHCSDPSQVWLQYSYINGSYDDTTNATLCHDDVSLFVKWFSADKEVISPYGNCNDPLYNADAVELFIATK